MHRALFALLLLAPAAAAQNTPASESEEWDNPGPLEIQPKLIGGLDSLQARVVYPEAAKRDGIKGVVVVQFVVTEAGEVEDAEVIRSPDERLNEAALGAVRASRFEPGTMFGEPTSFRFAVPVYFRLGNAAPRDEGASDPFLDYPELVGGLEGLRRRAESHREGAEDEEGAVRVRFVVDERMNVVGPEVVRSSGSARLDAAALAVARESRFSPGCGRCRPRPFEFAITVTFRLGGVDVEGH